MERKGGCEDGRMKTGIRDKTKCVEDENRVTERKRESVEEDE